MVKEEIFLFLVQYEIVRSLSLCIKIGCVLEHPTKWKIVCVEKKQVATAQNSICVTLCRQTPKVFRNYQQTPWGRKDKERVCPLFRKGENFAKFSWLRGDAFQDTSTLFFDPNTAILFKMYLKLF